MGYVVVIGDELLVISEDVVEVVVEEVEEFSVEVCSLLCDVLGDEFVVVY